MATAKKLGPRWPSFILFRLLVECVGRDQRLGSPYLLCGLGRMGGCCRFPCSSYCHLFLGSCGSNDGSCARYEAPFICFSAFMFLLFWVLGRMDGLVLFCLSKLLGPMGGPHRSPQVGLLFLPGSKKWTSIALGSRQQAMGSHRLITFRFERKFF